MANCRQFEVIFKGSNGIDHLDFYSFGNVGSKKLEDDAKKCLLRKYAEVPFVLSIQPKGRK